MRKNLFIILGILGNIAILLIAGELYEKMMNFALDIRFFNYSRPSCIEIDNLGSGGQLLVPTYLFLIIPISVFFAKKIKQLGVIKYWFINFILQSVIIILCQTYKGFFNSSCPDEVRNFYMILYDYFILPWDRFIVIFFTFSMITFGIYYNQLLWMRVLLEKKKNKDIIL